MASSREMKVKTLFIDFIVNFLLILFSAVSLSMVFWTILFGIPVYISILVVIIFSYESVIILFANIGIWLDDILDGMLRNSKCQKVVSDKEYRNKITTAICDGKSIYGKTFFRPELISGQHKSMLDAITGVSLAQPSPGIDEFEQIYQTYFSLENKLEILEYLNIKGYHSG